MTGVGKEPQFNQNEWGFCDNSVKFVNSNDYLDFAEQYFLTEEISSNIIDNTFSITNAQWKPWTIFVVCQVINSASYAAIFQISQTDQFTPWPKIDIEIGPTNFAYGIFNDGTHGGSISGTGGNIGTIDSNHHIIEISADGAGYINVWFDGVQVVTNSADFRPKTCNKISLGSYWGFGPLGWCAGFTGLVAHAMVFDQNLSLGERTTVRNFLKKKHNI